MQAPGRRRALRRRQVYPAALLVLLVIAIPLVGLPLYTPVLHHLAGDWVGGFRPQIGRADDEQWTTLEQLTAKVAQENLGAALNVLAREQVRDDSPLPTIRLELPPDARVRLDRDILRYGFGELEEKPREHGVSIVDGKRLPITAQLRGAMTWHHQQYKPSLRVRYRKGALVDGYRDHVLIAPEDPSGLRNWLSVDLARQWGLLTPDEHHVRVELNGRYLGLYSRTWRLDESLLIHGDRLPGPFFRLEDFTGPSFRRTRSRLTEPSTWEIKGVERDEGEAALQRLIDAIRLPPGTDRQERLRRLVDAESFARWLALLCHAGEIHVDQHNLALWLDTTTGRLEPVLLDVNGYDWAHPSNERREVLRAGNALVSAWLDDPRNLALYVERLRELLDGAGAPDAMAKRVREAWARIGPDARADLWTSEMGALSRTYTRTLYPVTLLDDDVENLIVFIERRVGHLRDNLALGRVVEVASQGGQVRVLVQAFAGVKADRVGAAEAGRHLGVARSPKVPLAVPFAVHELDGALEDWRFTNAATGEPIVPTRGVTPELAPVLAAPGLHPDRLRAPPPGEVVLGPGDVVIEADRSYGPELRVRLAPGTTVRLAPGVSLYVEGPLLVDGTAAAPVQVRPLDPRRPFGVLAALGSPSVEIRHLDLEGGSVARRENLELSGQLSIHSVPQVQIVDSRVGPNREGDDAVHVVGGHARFERVLVEGALFDAVDWDDVDGEVIGGRFLAPGNDGLDLSMTHASVMNCAFVACGDKCISVGEGSQVLVAGVDVVGAVWGVAAKDRAAVEIEDSRILDAEVGVGLYEKKWRWERGGSATLLEVEIEGSHIADLWRDRRSEAFADTALDAVDEDGAAETLAAPLGPHAGEGAR